MQWSRKIHENTHAKCVFIVILFTVNVLETKQLGSEHRLLPGRCPCSQTVTWDQTDTQTHTPIGMHENTHTWVNTRLTLSGHSALRFFQTGLQFDSDGVLVICPQRGLTRNPTGNRHHDESDSVSLSPPLSLSVTHPTFNNSYSSGGGAERYSSVSIQGQYEHLLICLSLLNHVQRILTHSPLTSCFPRAFLSTSPSCHVVLNGFRGHVLDIEGQVNKSFFWWRFSVIQRGLNQGHVTHPTLHASTTKTSCPLFQTLGCAF